MPFDTTYHIFNENNTIVTFTTPGGGDKDIYLHKGEIPPHLDSVIVNQLFKDVAETTTPPKKETAHYTPGPVMIITFLALFIFVLIRVRRNIKKGDENNSDSFTERLPSGDTYQNKVPLLTYYGDELNFSEEKLTQILTQRFYYFNNLSSIQKAKFLDRLQNFMANKTFKVHDVVSFKEMPVLISAAAIQLTFGLEKYLLPNFEFIHIYPQEFMRVQETICFLEGNVSGHAINLSWKHFLEGYENPDDGQNVGLHELAHALYYQTFIVGENIDHNFKNTFDNFNSYGNKVFAKELQPANNLYSEYAFKNFQEFWAESVEIFFEKPAAMKACYPQLYDSIKFLLNQDPYNNIASVMA